MIKLSLQMSHITFLPIQISHSKYIVHWTQVIGTGTPFTSHSACPSYLTSPPPQHHHIVQAFPISPSPQYPTSALHCVVFDRLFGFFQQSWVLWLNLWQILQKYPTLFFLFFFADSSIWSMTFLMHFQHIIMIGPPPLPTRIAINIVLLVD